MVYVASISGMIMDDELERMWNETVATYFKVELDVSGWTDENHE
jgi:hypothetical protein